MIRKRVSLNDISKNGGKPLANLNGRRLLELPYPLEKLQEEITSGLKEEQEKNYEMALDGITACYIPKPQNKEEEEALVQKFLDGLRKLFSAPDNWTFLQPLTITMDNCVKCQTCNEACPVYTTSGRQEIYRPTWRSEILRRLYQKYIKGGNGFLSRLDGNDIDLNWSTVARLAESSYRCTLCRRCAQTCPLGIDNGLVIHELRKLFSQEMGIAPKELHEKGTVLQLKVGASTGISPKALADIIDFIEEDITDRTGLKIRIPVDRKGADILLIHNTGEYLSWPENVAAFAIIFEKAGLSWTLSSELGGYEATNYGVWYDDVQLTKVAISQAKAAKELNVGKIVIGECGHAHKASIVVSDRVYPPDLNIPRESCFPVLEEIVNSAKLKLDPMRNNFPVTLHDPCNTVRLAGIVAPQRRILKQIAPQFREMNPHGVNNYCCGGGSGFAIMTGANMHDWKLGIAGRMKVKQVLDVFQDVIGPETVKYISAPCSNCKAQFRDLISYFNLEELCNIHYTGLVELIVNAMADIPRPFLESVQAPEAVEIKSETTK
ncbi:(Fe-S)-binding protein [Chloroflexota bacterium]